MPYRWPFPHQDVYDSELRTFQSYGQCKVPDCPDKRGMSVYPFHLLRPDGRVVGFEAKVEKAYFSISSPAHQTVAPLVSQPMNSD